MMCTCIVCFPRSMWKTIWQKDRFVKYVLKSPLLRRVERNVTRVLILSDTDLSHGKRKAGGELPRRPPMAEFCPFFPELKSPTNTTSQLWLLHKISFEMSHVKNYGVNWYLVFQKLVTNYEEISNWFWKTGSFYWSGKNPFYLCWWRILKRFLYR